MTKAKIAYAIGRWRGGNITCLIGVNRKALLDGLMKTKIVEILIVIFVVIVVAYAVGLIGHLLLSEETEANDYIFEITETNDLNFIAAWEPNYPIDMKFFGRDTRESVTFRLGKDNEIVCDGTIEKYLKILYQSMSGKEPTETIILRFAEPNDVIFGFQDTYYHPLDPRAYTCPKCYEGAKGDLCPGHKPEDD